MIHRLALPALAALMASGAAFAQPAGPRFTDQPGQTAPLSLQTQLGAIPLVSPRAMQQASKLRAVRLTQLSTGGQPVGETRAFDCPETGCQQAMALEVDGRPVPFVVDLQFVSRGAYVSLQTRVVEVAAVVEFEKGRRGPAFLRGASAEPIGQTLRFALAPAATLRRLDAAADGKTLATGNVYTRKLAPDVVLRVEIEPARERAP